MRTHQVVPENAQYRLLCRRQRLIQLTRFVRLNWPIWLILLFVTSLPFFFSLAFLFHFTLPFGECILVFCHFVQSLLKYLLVFCHNLIIELTVWMLAPVRVGSNRTCIRRSAGFLIFGHVCMTPRSIAHFLAGVRFALLELIFSHCSRTVW
jgi:hypothetical protein